jgi:hypothetical protein
MSTSTEATTPNSNMLAAAMQTFVESDEASFRQEVRQIANTLKVKVNDAVVDEEIQSCERHNKPLRSLRLVPTAHRFLEFPSDNDALFAWLNTIKQRAFQTDPDIKEQFPMRASFMTLIRNPGCPAVCQDVECNIHETGVYYPHQLDMDMVYGFSITDTSGAPITTTQNAVAVVLRGTKAQGDFVDGKLMFRCPHPTRHSFPHDLLHLRLKWGHGGLPEKPDDVVIKQHGLVCHSAIHGWLRNCLIDATIPDFCFGRDLLIKNHISCFVS